MKKFYNGRVVEMTDDEVKDFKRGQRRANRYQKTVELSQEEVIRLLLSQRVNDLEVDDNTALRMKSYYPTFNDITGKTVKRGFKFTHNDKLWQVIQPELLIQGHYPPGRGTESLYTEICESFDGTEDDPIPYEGNMALENGKFYTQGNVLYKCFRDTMNPVYHALSELVDLYVTVEDDSFIDDEDGGHGGNNGHDRPGNGRPNRGN